MKRQAKPRTKRVLFKRRRAGEIFAVKMGRRCEAANFSSSLCRRELLSLKKRIVPQQIIRPMISQKGWIKNGILSLEKKEALCKSFVATASQSSCRPLTCACSYSGSSVSLFGFFRSLDRVPPTISYSEESAPKMPFTPARVRTM